MTRNWLLLAQAWCSTKRRHLGSSSRSSWQYGLQLLDCEYYPTYSPCLSNRNWLQRFRSCPRLHCCPIWLSLTTLLPFCSFLTLTSRDAFSTTLENRHKKRDTPYRLGGGPRIAGLDKLGGGGGKNGELPPPCGTRPSVARTLA